MPEVTLKELSDRATPGRLDAQDLDLECQGFPLIAVPDETRVGGTPTLGLVAIVTLLPSECPLDHNGPDPRRARANTEYLSRLWTDHRAGHLHDDTALARARREALEEAAAKAEGQLSYWRERMRAEKCLEDGISEDGETYTPIGDVAARRGGYCNGRMGEAEWWISTLRSLAATPPEARQTETGWKPPAGWKLVPEKLTHAMADDIFRTTWPVPTLERAQALWAAGLERAPPPPAIGNLEGEGRSHG